ncbi:MAG: pantoate--beta-alanine ligase [Candidatus Omnitrophica bacterium]|nr:pantoate--beta-alanine ligase [Candidatus Omnitrophota bacterium]
MKVYRSIKPLIEEIGRLKRKQKSIGLVPTMGFLHEGHLSLMRRARRDVACVVVSIYVNPIQFGPKEDLRKYPRDLRRDTDLCREVGADICFIPDTRTMYPDGFSTYVNVEDLGDTLCGASRPGHFKGVTTVVAKLFNIVRPDTAYFGQKDAQQAIIIKRMVADLNMPVKIKVVPIVRERDGIAMSSRNIYLSPDERKEAVSLRRSLDLARVLYANGERDPREIIKKMRRAILKEKDAKIDYLSIVDLKDLKDINRISKNALVAVAVKIGKTRLIDNVILSNSQTA